MIKAGSGIDLFEDAKSSGFDISVEQLLNLLNSKGQNLKNIDEAISKSVKDLVKEVTIVDLTDFVNDHQLDFARYKKPKVEDAGLSMSGSKGAIKSASLFTMCAAVFALLLIFW